VPKNPARPDWRLPRGVTRGLWEHVHAEEVVGAYDERFSREAPRELDEIVLEHYLTPPGTVIDLGCGTGRMTIPLARRGFHCIAIDLSQPALAELGRQANDADLPIDRLVANLVELDALRGRSADACISMYSTLGMIRGRDNRRQALRHVRRLLKPGGTFVVHVHNRWYNLFQPQSRVWFLRNTLESLLRRDVEAGDKFYDHQGVPNFFLHVYTRGELKRELRAAGFRIERLVSLSVERTNPLRMPWLFGGLRAGGWIAICR
jgi:SAM-dependent methyltransferase